MSTDINNDYRRTAKYNRQLGCRGRIMDIGKYMNNRFYILGGDICSI